MDRFRFHHLAAIAAVLAFGVVVLGAFVRLSDAGLGCPDWPGCYGHITVPGGVSGTPAEYARPLEPGKAWKEMIHRYFAGTLGLLIAGLGGWAWVRRRRYGEHAGLPLFLVALVVFQALLGMWTVTWLLKPLVVTSHLLGGMTTLALLLWLTLRRGPWLPPAQEVPAFWRRAALAALLVVAVQIALGGWTSANYAALACPDFPTCYQGQWWPPTDFREAFTLWHGLGINYEGGILTHPARTAIHLTHRLGAVVTLLAVGAVVIGLLRRGRETRVRRTAAVVGVLLLVQVALGVGNVVLSLPLPVAVAHNGGAAALLLGLVALNHVLRPRTEPVAAAELGTGGMETA
ncbi:MAG TPA: COX15/CtaA family protein [Gammaproteobacteria bacterium]|nr:COX15/CtaA family protein [Gammaproteobacteria bacterium]